MNSSDDAESIMQDQNDDAKGVAPPATLDDDHIGIYRNGDAMSRPVNARIQLSQALCLRGPIITLAIGPAHEAVSIQVHQSVLTQTSDFFARALKPEWAAMREKPDQIELPAYSVKDVETYAHWL